MLALLDPDADLTETLLATGRGVVQLLAWEHRDLAEMFAGTAPAPGGMFRQAEFEQTGVGPAARRRRRPGPAYGSRRQQTVGWSTLVTSVVEQLEVGDGDEPLRAPPRPLRPAERSAPGSRRDRPHGASDGPMPRWPSGAGDGRRRPPDVARRRRARPGRGRLRRGRGGGRRAPGDRPVPGGAAAGRRARPADPRARRRRGDRRRARPRPVGPGADPVGVGRAAATCSRR